jgi:phosphatidate phosphatase
MDQIRLTRILYDIALLIFLLSLLIYTKYFLKPFNSGFYCNDFSINLVYKSSTVTNTVLQIIAIVIPFVFISFTEVFRTIHMKLKHSSLRLRNKYTILVCKNKSFELPEQIGNILINYIAYLFGLLCNANLTNIGKKVIGRLRPNFLDVCKPKQNPFNTLCQTYTTGITYLRPEIDFECNSPNKSEIDESRLSFPSGHSSTVFYTAIFLILFINKTWNKRSIGFIPQFVQFVLFAFAFFTALSRVVDHKHHPTDVLAGSVLGIVVAVFTYYYLNQFYKKHNFKSKYNSNQFYAGELRLKDGELAENELDNNNRNSSSSNNKKCFGTKVV